MSSSTSVLAPVLDSPAESEYIESRPAERSAIARLSLEHKLPLIIGLLLLAVIIALTTAAYAEVRTTSVRTASERLVSVTLQFRDLFQQSGVQLRSQMTTMARTPAIIAYAASPDTKSRADALAELGKTGPQGDQVVGTELRDSTGRVLLTTVPPGIVAQTLALDSETMRGHGSSDSAVIGDFRNVGDTLLFPVSARVAGADVWVVRWRRLAGSRRTREQITHLVGSEASLFLGNATGRHWTDLERPVARPPLRAAATQPLQTYQRDSGGRYLAAAAAIPGTPWLVVLDFPLRTVMEPVDGFMRQMALIATLALMLGLIAAWIMSRRITTPLRQLTLAADAIAMGDFSRRVRIQRSDELGRLGRAFGGMASEVRASRENLEHIVEARTADLNETLGQLHDAQESLIRRERLAMLGQLSSGVGHELRNPLGVMTNAVYYLRAVLSAAPQDVREYLEILQQQITLSEKIVGDLLDFARQKPSQRKPLRLREATDAQLARIGPSEGIRIENKVADTLPPVLVDPVQFGQIVINLLTNAAQAIDGPGSVSIRARVEGENVHYEISDTGPGIAPENLKKIFEPLFTTKARGIGLGLAVSRTLAQANAGDLTVSSIPGHGATFRLTLEAVR